MFQIVFVLFCLFLFAASVSMFSKSAEQRARSRTELFYASQIREEANAIRLQNEKTSLELFSAKKDRLSYEVKNEAIEMEEYSSSLINSEEVIQLPLQEIELKEVELDEKALDFVSSFQAQQEKIKLQDITSYEEPTSWFNFPEVDLHMNEKPEKGLYYVAGKVIDVLDEMSAVLSDGTGERLLYHHKVQNLSVGDILITQVEIHNSVWNFVNVWEINESIEYVEEKAM